jgi:hypothetical protein
MVTNELETHSEVWKKKQDRRKVSNIVQAINVPEPWPLFVLCFFCPCMCLPVFSSLLGFISSLPQLAWDKRLCCCCCCCCCIVHPMFSKIWRP